MIDGSTRSAMVDSSTPDPVPDPDPEDPDPPDPEDPDPEPDPLNHDMLFLLKKNDLPFDDNTKKSVFENMSMIVKDDLTNDLLYFMKFYQLTNEEQTSYFYIVFYELMSFIIRNDQNKLSQFHISLLNMFVYILLKNIVINLTNQQDDVELLDLIQLCTFLLHTGSEIFESDLIAVK